MPDPARTDAEDVRRTLAGDREAFGRLFDRHARSVRAVVAAVSCDFQAVEDMTQETFLRAHQRLATLNDPAAFRGWIHGIARLVAKEGRRQHTRHQEHTISTDVVLHDGGTGADAVEIREEQQLVLQLLMDLPERERLAVHAYFFHEQHADEAAAAMEISRSGFYAALERGLSRIRQRIAGLEIRSPKVRDAT
jgi:RNA polymerase sigma-70 factor (ECF subfamily)